MYNACIDFDDFALESQLAQYCGNGKQATHKKSIVWWALTLKNKMIAWSIPNNAKQKYFLKKSLERISENV